MFQTKIADKIKTHILFSITFSPENPAVYEMLLKQIWYSHTGQTDDIIRRMRFAYWIIKDKDTRSLYETLTAFPWQRWLRERASKLHSYVYCLYCY
jgi:predicted nucleotidyltransferase